MQSQTMKQLRKLLASRLGRSFSGSPTGPSSTPPQPTAPASSPPHARFLGFLGAIPFVALSTPIVEQFPVISTLTGVPHGDLGKLQVSYGATILSFLGGVHWGLAMTTLTPLKFTAERYIWSVCPCLAAFPTMILPVQQAAGIQAALIGLVYLTDRTWAKRGGLPLWYMKALRLPLSIIAGSSLIATAATTPRTQESLESC